MWPDDRFCRLMEIEVPIIPAPMAGSSSTAMAIAATESGALGSLACATLGAAELRSEVEAVRQRTDGPVNLDFFAHRPPGVERTRSLGWRHRLSPYSSEMGTPQPEKLQSGSLKSFDVEHCRVIEELRPKVVSFYFGLPSADLVERLRAAGVLVMSSAACVEEAIWSVERGCDAVIAQGYEAERLEVRG